MNSPKVYVFDNLVEASPTDTIKLGQPVNIEVAQPFTNKNAEGTIAPMSDVSIGARARAFGERFKSMSDQATAAAL